MIIVHPVSYYRLSIFTAFYHFSVISANFILNTISLSCHEQVCLSGLCFERYFSRWWEKYLSKRSPLKHTCSWRDKLIILWILNRQAKIFLRIILFFLIWNVGLRYWQRKIFYTWAEKERWEPREGFWFGCVKGSIN